MTDGGVPCDLSTEAASRRRKPVGEVGTTDDRFKSAMGIV